MSLNGFKTTSDSLRYGQYVFWMTPDGRTMAEVADGDDNDDTQFLADGPWEIVAAIETMKEFMDGDPDHTPPAWIAKLLSGSKGPIEVGTIHTEIPVRQMAFAGVDQPSQPEADLSQSLQPTPRQRQQPKATTGAKPKSNFEDWEDLMGEVMLVEMEATRNKLKREKAGYDPARWYGRLPENPGRLDPDKVAAWLRLDAAWRKQHSRSRFARVAGIVQERWVSLKDHVTSDPLLISWHTRSAILSTLSDSAKFLVFHPETLAKRGGMHKHYINNQERMARRRKDLSWLMSRE